MQIPHARGFQKISDGLPNSQGMVTFTPDRFKKYGVDKLGTDKLKLVAMIVRSGTDTPLDGEGAISLLSDTGIRATVNKSGLSTKTQELENVLQQEDPTITNGKTEDSKRAYAEAKEKANQAVTKGSSTRRHSD
ncbi:Uncharacterised protein [Streptococcus pneumoniae]|nr:Uncharacterised protein [Streptococcus pneumoniae]CIQ53115.1 Uncharacterised protein [Streptococcus pneumoniae]